MRAPGPAVHYTLAVVLVSRIIALLLGVPTGDRVTTDERRTAVLQPVPVWSVGRRALTCSVCPALSSETSKHCAAIDPLQIDSGQQLKSGSGTLSLTLH